MRTSSKKLSDKKLCSSGDLPVFVRPAKIPQASSGSICRESEGTDSGFRPLLYVDWLPTG